MRRLLVLTSLLLAVGSAYQLSRPAPLPSPGPMRPPPTENWLDTDAEKKNKAARKAWYKRMHRTPPDVRWEDIERENGRRQIARRNQLRVAPPMSAEVWMERGSLNQAGRMHVGRLASDGETLYAGSSLGGVWKGDLNGEGWTPIGDNLYGGAHWLEILPPDADGAPDIVIAATDGGLIHRTEDDGATWEEPSGVAGLYGVRRLLLTTDGDLFAYVNDANGYHLLRSTDKGQSFSNLRDFGNYQGDLWAPRSGGATLYLAGPDGVERSDDGGDTWSVIGTISPSGRVELAGSEAGAPRLWAVVDGSQLWRSDDAGASWTYLEQLGDYWGTLNASIQDADLFAYGGMEAYRTFSGGGFTKFNNWWDYYGSPTNLLHADNMGFDVALDADGREVWLLNTDGGIYKSEDGLQTVQNLSMSGLRVSQYYDVLTSSANPDHIAAGAQDQGYQLTNGLETASYDIKPFEQVLSGDYGHLTSSDGTHAYVYSVYPGFILVQIGEDNPSLDYLDFPGGETYVPWLPPIVADPDDQKAFFFPATHLYRYERKPSGAWETSLYSEQSFGDGGDYISALTFSPLDSSRAWLATANGRIFYSTDHGVTWTQSQNLGPDENWYYGQAIVASHLDVDTVYIGGSGYGVPAVYRSTDGGFTFAPWSDDLPDTLVYCMVMAPDDSGTVFVGTQTSAYKRTVDGTWEDITDNTAPITTYWSCEALTHENTIRFGTYGRGIWDYQLDPEGTGCYPVQDYDGDGALCDEDCDDHDPGIAPGREDACDGEDVNCDGASEVDGDGDGYLACEECDDGAAGAFPGATEVCDNDVDEDCDGADLSCDEDMEDPGKTNNAPNCGCATGGDPRGLFALALVGLLLRRRRA